MKKSLITFSLLCSIFLIAFSCKHEIPVISLPVTSTVCFEEDVLPVFQTNCAKSGCHDSVIRESGHQLDRYSTILRHGIIAGDSSGSEIYQLIIESNSALIMPPPPNAPLTATQINTIGAWIEEG